MSTTRDTPPGRLGPGERKQHELAELLAIARSCAGLTDARELYGALPERAARLVGAERFLVATYDPEAGTTAAESGYNVPPEVMGRLRFPEGDAPLGEPDLTTGAEPVYLNDPAPAPGSAAAFLADWGVRSVLCAPMRVKGLTIGFLYAADKPGGFDADDARLLAIVAAVAAEAISNARLFAALQAQARREALLNRITGAVRESLELDEILGTAVRMLGRSLDLCRCYVALVDMQRQVVRIAHEFRVPEIASAVGEYPIAAYGDRLLKSLQQGNVFAVDDVETDARVLLFRDKILRPLGVRSLMYVPASEEGSLLAVLGLSQCRRTRKWTAEEATLAQAIADQVAVGIRQARLFDSQRRAAEHRALSNRIGTAVRATLDLDTILETTVKELGAALAVDRCYVLGPGPFPATVETSTARFEYCRPGVTSVRGFKMPVRNRAREGPVAMIEEPLVIADIDENPRLVSRRKSDLLALTETRALLAVRAVYGEQVLAIVELNQCEPRQWSREDVELASEVAAHLAVGIHKASLFRQVASSERQWHTTFNAMTDGFALLDPSGAVVRLNDSMLRFCGVRSHEEAAGRPVYEILYGEEHDGVIQRVLTTSQRVQIERDLVARNVSLRESIDPIFDEHGAISGLVLVVRDVTREREADRAIRYRNRQLAALNAIAAATKHTHDLEAIVEGAFARIIDVTGADAGVVLMLDESGGRLDPLATHGGAAVATSLVGRDATSPVARAVLTADAPLTFAELARRRDVALSDVAFSPFRSGLVAPIRSQQRALGILEIAYASERPFSANERQLLAVAGQQIGAAAENAQLIANLQQALGRVQEANRLKDEFLAVVSHELRTPLTAIQGWSEVLSDPEVTPDQIEEGINAIHQASTSLTQLISDLLDLSRIEHRMLRLDLQVIDPNYPVQAAVMTVRQMAEAKGVAVEYDLGLELPRVKADPGRMQQVVWNLLANAIKFTPSGGRVHVTTDAPSPGMVRVQVADTGIGIPPEFLPHVFERFRQADGSITRQFGGLGLGLSLVRSLVEAHGGTVEATSGGRNQGATFTVTLPTAE